MATLINVKTLIKLFFTAFLFFSLLLIISAVVALPPRSPPPRPQPPLRFHPPRERDHQARDHTRDPAAEAQYQVFHIKNATPFFLDGEPGTRGGRRGIGSGYNHRHHHHKRNQRAKTGKMKKTRMKMTSTSGKNDDDDDVSRRGSARQFSVMLPKGFVPPSGSSPCHNAKPDESTKGAAAATATSYSCRLSAAEP
ncbi:unnamed protein product [Linum tenue]|uniref:Uncharacterized protein n=1 Tax=Linum tenue TaxID=586396 RepID=A0AAV0QJK1_9ROSI|nr:unnamed protein product [Linum tenue]